MYILGYINYLTHRLGWKPEAQTSPGAGGQTAKQAGERGVGHSLRWALATLRAWHQRRAAIRQLESLSNAALRDIGLDRAEIPATVSALIQAKNAGGDPDLSLAGAHDPGKVVCCG